MKKRLTLAKHYFLAFWLFTAECSMKTEHASLLFLQWEDFELLLRVEITAKGADGAFLKRSPSFWCPQPLCSPPLSISPCLSKVQPLNSASCCTLPPAGGPEKRQQQLDDFHLNSHGHVVTHPCAFPSSSYSRTSTPETKRGPLSVLTDSNLLKEQSFYFLSAACGASRGEVAPFSHKRTFKLKWTVLSEQILI